MAEGSGLAPFERHGADLGLLEESAAELVRLSNQAIDQEEATITAFDPATDGWEGIAAPELRSAPDGVQQDAFEVSSAVYWGSVPLRTWAAWVTEFNRLATQYEADCAAELASLTMPADPAGSPNVALAVDSARATTRMHWEQQWRDAYETHIVDGAEAVARMYRDGPTEENLRLAGFMGALVAPSGAGLVLPAMWHDSNMRQEADDAIALANRILAEGEPSRRDLERLNNLLAEYGTDPAFAYHLLDGLGPERLLELTADVAFVQRDENNGNVDRDLALLVGSIQAGLGVALATGTRPHADGRYELGDDWEERLFDAGEQRVHIDWTDWEPYGFHVLGVLLSNREAEFDSEFLAGAGGRMVDFELERLHEVGMSAGAGYVWGVSALDFGGVRLNWVNGYGEDAAFGEDPMVGLMAALSEDPLAARLFFSTESTVDGQDQSRVDYLLTERYWFPDTPFYGDEAPGALEGLANLGGALEAATSQREGAPIVADIVRSVNANGLVDDSLRRPLGNIAADWMDSMYQGIRGGDPLTGLDDRDVAPFLQELGRDDGAREAVVSAAAEHGMYRLDAVFDRGDQERETLSTLLPTAEVMRALDVGNEDVVIEGLEDRRRVFENITQAGRNALDLTGPGAIAGLAVDATGLDDAIVDRFGGDGDVDGQLVEMQAATRDTLEGIYWAVVAHHGGPEGHFDDAPDRDHYAGQANLVANLYVNAGQLAGD